MNQHDVILECRHVGKHFGGLQALHDVSLTLRRGEILGLVGPNGSGKTTLINVISGYLPCDQGQVLFEGRVISGMEPHKIAAAGISRTYQIPHPFRGMTVLENVMVAAQFGHAHGRPRDLAAYAMQWLDFVGLGAFAHRPVGSLNLHQLKFLEMARALAARPKVLMLDEVLAGLNPGEMEEGVALVARIRDTGTTIVMVEHIMRAVTSLADRVVVLDQGKYLAEGPPAEVLRRPEVVKAYLGSDYHA
ncbi:MAG: ABC transporter ATP-binding protein [Limnochordales bacterium]